MTKTVTLGDQTPFSKSPDPIDLHVGGRIRMRRKFMGMSQEALAEAINLTFQQVQKYERASNRISASKLKQTADALKVPVGYFFEDMPDQAEAQIESTGNEQKVSTFLMTTEGIELAGTFPDIRSPRLRRKIIELVRAAADNDNGELEAAE